MELVTGATGYVGGRLLRRLAGDGRAVRALAREPGRLEPLEGVEAARGDLLSGEGLADALDGCSTAYYLVHSMERGDHGDFAARDRRAAQHFARAAREAGVERAVYLGGIAPARGPSPHLRSRIEVEEILLEQLPRSTALRASIVIGADSPSFLLLVRLVERLRLLPMPAWRDNRTQPIDERDVLAYLARTPATPGAEGRSLDIVGPELMTLATIVERIAELMGVGRTLLPIGRSLTPPVSAMVSALTDQPLELVRPLMESLESDILPRDAREAAHLYRMRPRPFDRAAEHALADWERREPLAAR